MAIVLATSASALAAPADPPIHRRASTVATQRASTVVAQRASTVVTQRATLQPVDTPAAPTEHNDGLLGPVRLGAFGGVGFPRPLSVEGMIKFDDLIGVGLEYGALPSMTISGVNASLNAVAGDIRVFPMRNGFFIGVAFGHQHLDIASTVTLPAQIGGTVSGEVTGDSWYVNPRLGFLWTLRWGLTVGFDAGAQIPVSYSMTNTIPSELSLNQTATNVAQTFGKNVLPTVNLLRLGMLF